MAISIAEEYPGKTAGTNTNYPYGQARDVVSPGDGLGTPWKQGIVNDDQGFKQALLIEAGIVPSGVPDTAVASQYLQAIKALISDAQPVIRDRHFVRFQGNATIVKNSGGVLVSVLGVGYYEITLPSAAPDTNYMVFITGATGGGEARSINLTNDPQTTTKFRIHCKYGGDNTVGSFTPDFINVRVVY